MPKAATESTGASMSGRTTSNIAANSMIIGIGRNTYSFIMNTNSIKNPMYDEA